MDFKVRTGHFILQGTRPLAEKGSRVRKETADVSTGI